MSHNRRGFRIDDPVSLAHWIFQISVRRAVEIRHLGIASIRGKGSEKIRRFTLPTRQSVRIVYQVLPIIILTVFSLIVQNFLDYRLAEGEVKWLARTLVSIYGYVIRPVILILLLRVIAPEKHYGWAWALAGVNAAVNATALFSHLCFWIDEHNHFQGGPLKDTCLIVSAALLIYWFALTIRVFTLRKRQETWVPLMVMALIAGAIELDSEVGLIAQPMACGATRAGEALFPSPPWMREIILR